MTKKLKPPPLKQRDWAQTLETVLKPIAETCGAVAAKMKLLFESLFLFVWAAFALVWAINAIIKDGFNYGGRGGSIYVTPASHPKIYWMMVTVAVLSGIGVTIIAVCDLRRRKKRTF